MATLLEEKVLTARVYCPICTHTVDAEVVAAERGWRRKLRVVGGQRCKRCSAPLDAAYILDPVGSPNG